MIPSIGSQLAVTGSVSTATSADAPMQSAQTGHPDGTVQRSSTEQLRQIAPDENPPASAVEAPKSSLEKALEAVNNSLKAWSTGLRFDTDEDTHRLVVSIVDSATGDVLKKIPSDAMLQVARMIAQFQGRGIDTEA